MTTRCAFCDVPIGTKENPKHFALSRDCCPKCSSAITFDFHFAEGQVAEKWLKQTVEPWKFCPDDKKTPLKSEIYSESEFEERFCENPTCRGKSINGIGFPVRVLKNNKSKVECNECFNR